MRKSTLRAGLIGGVFMMLLGGCGTGRGMVLDDAARDEARAALLATDRAGAEAASTDDVDRIVTFWTDDAVIARSRDQPEVVGIEPIREFIEWNRQDRPGFSISWQPTHAWVSADGTAGCTMGDGAITFPNEETGELMTVRDRYCCAWRKVDGQWKCVLDLGVPDSGIKP